MPALWLTARCKWNVIFAELVPSKRPAVKFMWQPQSPMIAMPPSTTSSGHGRCPRTCAAACKLEGTHFVGDCNRTQVSAQEALVLLCQGQGLRRGASSSRRPRLWHGLEARSGERLLDVDCCEWWWWGHEPSIRLPCWPCKLACWLVGSQESLVLRTPAHGLRRRIRRRRRRRLHPDPHDRDDACRALSRWWRRRSWRRWHSSRCSRAWHDVAVVKRWRPLALGTGAPDRRCKVRLPCWPCQLETWLV